MLTFFISFNLDYLTVCIHALNQSAYNLVKQSPIKKLDMFLIRFVYVFFSYKKRIIKRI